MLENFKKDSKVAELPQKQQGKTNGGATPQEIIYIFLTSENGEEGNTTSIVDIDNVGSW